MMYVIVVRCRHVVYVRPSVLLNRATSASCKPQALRHHTSGLNDIMFPYMGISQPDRLYTGPIKSLSACTQTIKRGQIDTVQWRELAS